MPPAIPAPTLRLFRHAQCLTTHECHSAVQCNIGPLLFCSAVSLTTDQLGRTAAKGAVSVNVQISSYHSYPSTQQNTRTSDSYITTTQLPILHSVSLVFECHYSLSSYESNYFQAPHVSQILWSLFICAWPVSPIVMAPRTIHIAANARPQPF